MKLRLWGFIGILLSLQSLAQTADLPTLRTGDTWVYRDTVEKGPNGWSQSHNEINITRTTSSAIYYASKQSGSTQPGAEKISGADWSRMRDVNGKETVVNRPLDFPLTPGKTWELRYTEQHPNKAHKFEAWSNKFTVVGYETVEVPAGKFSAIKIEAEGRWTAEMEPTSTVVQGAQSQKNNTTMVTQVQKTEATPSSGRTYKAFWYVPEVKRWIKSVEEYYGSNGVRNERYVGELESFKVTN